MWDQAQRTRWERNAQAMIVGAGRDDPDAFAEMVRLAEWIIGDGLRTAALLLKEQGYSWASIAEPLGVTREAAFQRFRPR
jgi:hypothetical protein